MRICDVNGCEKKHKAKGFCEKHYVRMKNLGTLNLKMPRGTAYERVIAKIKNDNGCWLYTGGKNNGYGNVQENGKTYLVHRVVYEHYHGLIPKGLEIDHVCRNRSCVNPEHLEAVTPKENVRRSMNYRDYSYQKRDKNTGRFKAK